MISEIARLHFIEIWKLFDRRMLDVGGSMFLIEPFKQYFSLDFAKDLTPEIAKKRLQSEYTNK